MEAAQVIPLHAPHPCPHCERMEQEVEEITAKWKGELLKNRRLSANRHAELWGNPDRPKVVMLHMLHAEGTKANKDTPTRRKKLDSTELENALRCIHTLGLRKCMEAVVGLTWDPSWSPKPGKNGRKECFNTFELLTRTSAKCLSYAERAPIGWEPDVEKVEALTGVPAAQIVEWLGVEE